MQLTDPVGPVRLRAGNDNAPGPSRPFSTRRLGDDVLMGLRLYSWLPTGDRPHEPPELARIAPALPIVSVLIGLGPIVLLLASALMGLPGPVAAALAVALLVWINGGMAEDALADSFDGLFGGRTAEQRLDIMRDPRHGTFGIAALCLLLVLRVFVLAALLTPNPVEAAGVWLGAMVMSRSGALWLARVLPPARRDGLSAAAGQLGRMPFLYGAALALAAAFVVSAPAAGLLPFLLSAIVAAAVALGWARLCAARVGGQTGDLIGALQALLEIVILLVLLIFT